MVGKSIFVPKLKGTTEINYNWVRDFHLFSSMLTGLPFGFFTVVDEKGGIYQKFENLQIGASIKFTCTSENSDLNGLKLENYIVLGIQSINENDTSNGLEGKIIVYFGHKLFLFQDTKSHAYPEMSKTALVKKVLEDETRGFKVELKSSEESDEPLPHTYYKICESDWDFLKYKIEPISSHSDQPMHLFADAEGNFYFMSFASLYSEPSKYVLIPKSINEEPGNETKFKDYVAAKSSLKFSSFDKVESKIGGREFLDEAIQNFHLDAADKLSSASGIKLPVNSAGKLSSPKFSVLPIDIIYSNSDGQPFVSRNRFMTDALLEFIGNSRHVDFGVSLLLTMDFEKDLMDVGSSVDIYIKHGHWANDKWLITNSVIFNENVDRLRMTLTLSRPVLIGNKNDTTLTEQLNMLGPVS